MTITSNVGLRAEKKQVHFAENLTIPALHRDVHMIVILLSMVVVGIERIGSLCPSK